MGSCAGYCNCGDDKNDCVNYQKSKPKDVPTPSSGNLDADWLNLCGEIMMGRAKDVDRERIIKEMIDAGRSAEVTAEFTRIGKLLRG